MKKKMQKCNCKKLGVNHAITRLKLLITIVEFE